MFLREYLYVDLDKISGLASQLYDGVPEKATNIAARQRNIEVDLKIAKGGRGSSTEGSIESNLGDSLFKDLEADLEAMGLLEDLSEPLSQESAWNSINDLVSPGKILRITAPGTLFHPAHMSDALVGLATAAHGIATVSSENENDSFTAPIPPKAKTSEQKKFERAARNSPEAPRFPEDLLPPGDTVPLMDISREQLSGMIKVARGVFGEGVHLHLRPAGPDGPAISGRLEGGRRFLDSSPEVLMARYGLSEQEWTIVGIVGQLGSNLTTTNTADIANSDGSVNRAKFVDLVANLLANSKGLIDLPQSPGFSVVPLALYRTIGNSVTTGE